MANLLPKPIHQQHFDATLVYKDGRVEGVNLVIGSRKVYLDLPRELEEKVEAVFILPSSLVIPEDFKKEWKSNMEKQPTLLTRAKSAIKGKRK